MTTTTDRVPTRVKFAYGVGSIAYGIKDNGFATFLLLFYNQVIGLPAATVGLVIALALVFDAFVDPLLGVLSDRTNTRLGRRHPWLYASALPIAAFWILMWHPPVGQSQPVLLAWLFVFALLVRAAIATNEVPSYALAPEMTRDYHERTAVFAWRYLFGWLGGLTFLMLAFGYFLAPPRGAQLGPLAVEGYGNYGIAGGIIMALAVLASAWGTQKYALSRPQASIPRMTVRETFAAIRQTLRNRAFLILMAGGVCSYTAQGVSFSLSNYLLNFVWQFRPADFLIYAAALFLGAIIAFVMAAPIGRALGKKRAACVLTAIATLVIISPYVLRLLGLFPEPGSPQLLPTFLTLVVFQNSFSVAAYMTTASMMSDVTEASEEVTGRREEGLFFAGALFMQKCTHGIGILATGIILALSAFPDGAVKGAVPEAVLDRLTIIFALGYGGLQLLAVFVLSRFPFGRDEHEARLARLAAATAPVATERG